MNSSSGVSEAHWFSLHDGVLAHHLLSLACYEVPNSLAKERRQKGVQRRRLLQEGIQSFKQRLLITQLIIDHSHITCQQFTRYVWKPENRRFKKDRCGQRQNTLKVKVKQTKRN